MQTLENIMNDTKTEQVNLRMSPRAKRLLKVAAEREHRSATNMVEYLVFAYCEQHGIDLPTEGEPLEKKSKGAGDARSKISSRN